MCNIYTKQTVKESGHNSTLKRAYFLMDLKMPDGALVDDIKGRQTIASNYRNISVKLK